MGGGTRSCEANAEALKQCLRKTECYQSGQFTMKECLAKTTECRDLHHAYVACMRSQVDMRTRIQGTKGV